MPWTWTTQRFTQHRMNTLDDSYARKVSFRCARVLVNSFIDIQMYRKLNWHFYCVLVSFDFSMAVVVRGRMDDLNNKRHHRHRFYLFFPFLAFVCWFSLERDSLLFMAAINCNGTCFDFFCTRTKYSHTHKTKYSVYFFSLFRHNVFRSVFLHTCDGDFDIILREPFVCDKIQFIHISF